MHCWLLHHQSRPTPEALRPPPRPHHQRPSHDGRGWPAPQASSRLLRSGCQTWHHAEGKRLCAPPVRHLPAGHHHACRHHRGRRTHRPRETPRSSHHRLRRGSCRGRPIHPPRALAETLASHSSPQTDPQPPAREFGNLSTQAIRRIRWPIAAARASRTEGIVILSKTC